MDGLFLTLHGEKIRRMIAARENGELFANVDGNENCQRMVCFN
jgi:hypothetical protein